MLAAVFHQGVLRKLRVTVFGHANVPFLLRECLMQFSHKVIWRTELHPSYYVFTITNMGTTGFGSREAPL